MAYLEDFRYNDITNSYFILPEYSNKRIYKTYDKYATKAFNDSFKDICDLENSRMFMIHSGSNTLSSISFLVFNVRILHFNQSKNLLRKIQIEF